MFQNSCKSTVCKAQLREAYGKVKEVNHVVRSLTSSIEDSRVEAERHQQHLKYLKKHFLELGGRPLNENHIQNLFFEAGDNPVFEVPEDVSIISLGSSTNSKLPEQSLSSDDMEM